MSVSVVILAILSTPYLYFGWKILAINLACATYNLGVNIPVLLFAGSYNKKKIDLEKSPFMNYQGTGATQWIVGLPLFVVPTLIFYGVATFLNSEIAIIVLALFGIIGIGMRSFLIDKIAEGFRKRKYATVDGFKQQEN
jgi:ABC-type arginine transport system permease subunit